MIIDDHSLVYFREILYLGVGFEEGNNIPKQARWNDLHRDSFLSKPLSKRAAEI